jgi:hypothetical protein
MQHNVEDYNVAINVNHNDVTEILNNLPIVDMNMVQQVLSNGNAVQVMRSTMSELFQYEPFIRANPHYPMSVFDTLNRMMMRHEQIEEEAASIEDENVQLDQQQQQQHQSNEEQLDHSSFDSQTDRLQQQYIQLTSEIAKLESVSRVDQLLEEQDIQTVNQQMIDKKYKELQSLKHTIFLRKYAKQAFHQYFASPLVNIPDTVTVKRRNELDDISKQLTLALLEKDKNDPQTSEWKKHSEAIDQLTWYITGLDNEEFLSRLSERINTFNGTQSSQNSNSTSQKEEEKSILKLKLKTAKDRYSKAQKEFRLLQHCQTRIETERMNRLRDPYNTNSLYRQYPSGLKRNRTKTTSGTIVLKEEDLTPFELNVLEADIESYRLHMQSLRLEITELQEAWDNIAPKTSTGVSQKPKSVKSVKTFKKSKADTDTTSLRDPADSVNNIQQEGQNDWLSYLDFSNMDNEDQKKLFIKHAESRLYPRNIAIRKQFERTINSFGGNYLNLYSDPHFWKIWFQKRQAHEYAKMLSRKYNPSVSQESYNGRLALQDTILNAEILDQPLLYRPPTAPREDIDLYHDLFFFDEEMFPAIDFTRVYSESPQNNNIHWRDNYYRYVVRQRPLDSNKKNSEDTKSQNIIQVPTHSDPHLWYQIFQIRTELFAAIRTASSSKQIRLLYDKYTYALCRVSQQRGIVSNILSKYLRNSYRSSKNKKQSSQEQQKQHKVAESEDKKNKTEPVKKSVVVNNPKSNKLYNMLLKRRELYASTRGVIAKFISDLISKRVKVFCHKFQSDRYHFYTIFAGTNKESVKYSLRKFVIQVFQSAALQQAPEDYIRFCRGLLCTSIRQRLLEDSPETNKFWTSLSNNAKESIYSNALNEIIREEVEQFVYPDTIPDEKQEVESILEPYEKRATNRRSIKSGRSKQPDNTDQSELQSDPHQWFNATTDVPSISALLVAYSPEELQQRMISYLTAKRGQPMYKLRRSDVREFVTDEVSYLVNDKHYTMFSGGLLKPEESLEFLPLVEYSKLQRDKQALFNKLQSLPLDEKLQVMRTEYANLKRTEEFLDLKLSMSHNSIQQEQQ